jgi:hypothetical protein
MSKRISLNPVGVQQILASIRSGGYPHIAAAAWGVTEAMWEKWRRWATGKRTKREYKDFFGQVEQAQGQARLRAEIQALGEDPRTWLKHGPGKELPNKPGWSALPRPALPKEEAVGDWLSSPVVLDLLTQLRSALAPYPDALAAVTKALKAK